MTLTLETWPLHFFSFFQLMFILNNSDYNNILSWTTDGQAFVFHDAKAFETVVLPSTFKDSKFDSFLRKVSNIISC